MKKGMIILSVLAVILSCSAGRNEEPKSAVYEVGESVYVCGCPMMCCNSISKEPGGRCACNVPLRKGTVCRIRDGKVYVKVSGREKSFFINNP